MQHCYASLLMTILRPSLKHHLAFKLRCGMIRKGSTNQPCLSFLAVQDSSIGDIVSQSVSQSSFDFSDTTVTLQRHYSDTTVTLQ